MRRSLLQLMRAALLLACLAVLVGSPASGASPLVPRAAAPSAPTVTILHSFKFSPASGAYSPGYGVIQGPDGSLYGITADGTGYPNTVFQIAPDGTFRTLHVFSSKNDGNLPLAKLLLVGNQLFGTCSTGGMGDVANGGAGTVFAIDLAKVSPTDNAAGFSVIHYFALSTSSPDGEGPKGALFLASDGDLYGTTGSYNTAYPVGSIFQIKPDNGGRFSVTPRTIPSGMDTFNGSYATIYGFGVDAASRGPYAGVVQGPGGFLYGITRGTGGGGGPTISGTVYKVGTDGSGFTVLHAFPSDYRAAVASPDGAKPQSVPLFASDGNLYATALYGGQIDGGTVFQIKPGADGVFGANAPFQLLHDFSTTPDGFRPADGLIQVSDGTLFGATAGGGIASNSTGSIFSVAPSGGQFSAASPFSTLYSFNPNNGGPSQVSSPLVQGSDGRLYGETTFGGGSGAEGTVFAVDAGLPAPPAVTGVAGSIAPPDVTTGDTTLVVHGTGFAAGGTVTIDGLSVPVTSRDYSQADELITVTLSSPLRAGAHTIIVADTAPGIRVSNPVAFLVTLLSPQIIQITRGGGGAVTDADTTLVIHGNSFVPGDIVNDGTVTLPTTSLVVDPTGSQITVTLSQPLALGHHAVTVTHAAPNGLVSNSYDLLVVTSLAPVTGLELTVNNSVPVSGVILTPGGVGFSGTATLMQLNPDPNSLPRPKTPAPKAAPRSAPRAALASATTANSPIIDHVRIETVLDDTTGQPAATFLIVEGSNFDPALPDQGKVTFDGQPIPNLYISHAPTNANSLQCTLTAVLADNKTHSVSVTNPDGQTSQAVPCGVLTGTFTGTQFVAEVPTSYQVSINESSLVGAGTSLGVTGQSPAGSSYARVAIGQSSALVGGNLIGQDGSTIVAQGGGNIVAQGGGNLIGQGGSTIVAQGGGNIVAQGGGNLISQDGGNIVAQGGGNLTTDHGVVPLIGQDGSGLKVAGDNVLAGAAAGFVGHSSLRAFALRGASALAATPQGSMDVTLFVTKGSQGMRLLVTRYTPGERDLILYKDPGVTVTPSAGTPAPVAAITAGVAVTRGPVTRDAHTHQPFQVLTLTNTGAGALAGPFLLGISGLPAGVTVAGQAGVVAGSPAVTVPGSALAPRASVQVRVDFTDPTNARFSYGVAVYAGL